MFLQAIFWLGILAQVQDAPPALRKEWVNWKPSDAPPAFESVDVQTWMERIGFEASGRPWNPHAETLFGMAEKATRSVFGVDSLRLRARSADAQKGTIAVHWEFVSGDARGDLYLEDVPFGARFGMRVQGLTVAEMTDVAPKLFRTTPRIQVAADGSAQFAWGLSMAQIDMMNYRAVATRNAQSGDWFMRVFHSRLRLADHYRGVTEEHRIPAFFEVLKEWSLDRMLGELRSTSPDAERRNQTIFDEIASRNLPDNVWKEILGRGPRHLDWLQGEWQSILSALRLADPSFTRIGRLVEPVADWVEALLPGGDFRPLTGVPCSDPFETIAFRFLEKKRNLADAVRYLGSCSATQTAVDRLSSLSPPSDELKFQIRNALDSIRGRISKQ